MLSLWRQFWPSGWRPDPRTVGMFVFGVLGIAAVGGLISAEFELTYLFTGRPPGAPSDVQGLGFQIPTAFRIVAGTDFFGAIASAVAAIGGLAIMARTRWGMPLAAVAIMVIVLAVAIVTAVEPPQGIAIVRQIVYLAGLLALLAVVIGWSPRLPKPRERPRPEARSWMEDVIDDE